MLKICLILEFGLKAGSSLDFTGGWAEEYPVQIEVPGARKGIYVEHNDYYRSSNTAAPTKVTVNLDASVDSEQQKVILYDLIKTYPQVEFQLIENGKLLKTLSRDLSVHYDEYDDTWVVECPYMPLKEEVANFGDAPWEAEFDNEEDATDYAIINSGIISICLAKP
jgi:hypothetical protein